MPIDAERVQVLFHAAADIGDPAERARFLDGACGSDPDLKRRVEALLRADDEPDSLLDQPAPIRDPIGSDSDATRSLRVEPANEVEEKDDTLAFLESPGRPDSLGKIGHYEMLQVLGRGGFGVVFRAFDEVLHRIVAVKVLSPQMAATSPARKRFLREARSSAQVRHENIVQVYEIGETPLPYIAMEFIPGETLQQRLDRTGPLEVTDVVRIGRQVAEGLTAAHATDLIHRDIKPANILLESGSARVKITDFGLARAVDDASISQSGVIAGTPMYMAPEQANGDPLDQRADLFSLGSVLYVMTTGRPPFRASGTPAVLKRVALDEPRAIREIMPETPPWLIDLIAKLHAKKPEDRFQTAREVADVLVDCEAQMKEHANLIDFARIPKSELAPEPIPVNSSRWKWVATALLVPLLVWSAMALIWPGPTARPKDDAARLQGQWEVIDGEDKDGPVPVARMKDLPWFTFTGDRYTNDHQGKTYPGAFALDPSQSPRHLDLTPDGFEKMLAIYELTGDRLKICLEEPGKPRPTAFATDPNGGRVVLTFRRAPPRAEGLDPDRKAAEWALSVGGAVKVDNGSKLIRVADDLPRDRFRLMEAHLFNNPRVTDDGLSAFRDCRHVKKLFLYQNPGVTDTGLAHFSNCRNLAQLHLQDSGITDAGLAVFKGTTVVTDLYLSGSKVTDAGLENFKDCKGLTSLALYSTAVTEAGLVPLLGGEGLLHLDLADVEVGDAALKPLRGCKNLLYLYLNGSRVTDAGLADLTGMARLQELNLSKTAVTKEAVEKLAKALPKCKITWDGGKVEPKPAGQADRKAAEWALSVGGSVRVNGGKREIKTVADLPRGPFRLTAVDVHDNKRVTDAGLEVFEDCEHVAVLLLYYNAAVTDAGLKHFAKCKSLAQLHLQDTGVTDAGLATFKGTTIVTDLYLSGPKVTDAGLENFKDCKAMSYLAVWKSAVTDAGLAHFKGCKALIYLRLTDDPFGDAALEPFRECKNLETLNLSRTLVNDRSLAMVKEWKFLRLVYLSGTAVTDAGLTELMGLERLEELHLSKTAVTREGIQKLAMALPKCKVVWDGDVVEPK